MSMSFSSATGGGGSASYSAPPSFALMADRGSIDPDGAPLSEQEQIVYDTQNSYLDQKFEREWFEDRFVSKPEFQIGPGLKYLQDLNPAYYDPEEQRIDEEAEMQKNIAKILMRGPQTPEDLDVIKAVIRNKYRPKNEPLQNLYTGYKAPPIRRGPLSRIRGTDQLKDRYYRWDQKNADTVVAWAGQGFSANTYWEDFLEALDLGDSGDYKG